MGLFCVSLEFQTKVKNWTSLQLQLHVDDVDDDDEDDAHFVLE
jgi:hypothetical protein